MKTQRHRCRRRGCCRRCCCSARSAGALYALIPALCRKVRFGASEILVSLMLVYVADLCSTIWCAARGAIPKGFNFPTTAEFDPVATVPLPVRGRPACIWARCIALIDRCCRVAGAARPHHQGL